MSFGSRSEHQGIIVYIIGRPDSDDDSGLDMARGIVIDFLGTRKTCDWVAVGGEDDVDSGIVYSGASEVGARQRHRAWAHG